MDPKATRKLLAGGPKAATVDRRRPDERASELAKASKQVAFATGSE